MGQRTSLHDLLNNQVETIEHHLGGVRDGTPASVHDARVATRRIREVLAVLEAPSNDEVTALRGLVRRAGRALGRVRELDVMEEHLRRASAAVPVLSLPATAALEGLAPLQRRERRRMIKRLEALDMDRLVVDLRRLARPPHWWSFTEKRGSVRPIWTRIGHHASRLNDELARASAVYFARRAHSVRIRVKKLRYALEVTSATRRWTPPHMLNDLKAIQGALGEAHDGQVLRDALPSLVAPELPARERLADVVAVIDADIETHYREYVQQRERLAAICALCERRSQQGRWWRQRRLAA